MSNATRIAGNASTVIVRRGMGPLGVLGIIFVLCKIFAFGPIAAWSWWLVLLPFYVGIAIVLGIWVLIAVVAATAAAGVFLFYGLQALWQRVFPTKAQRTLRAYRIDRKPPRY